MPLPNVERLSFSFAFCCPVFLHAGGLGFARGCGHSFSASAGFGLRNGERWVFGRPAATFLALEGFDGAIQAVSFGDEQCNYFISHGFDGSKLSGLCEARDGLR